MCSTYKKVSRYCVGYVNGREPLQLNNVLYRGIKLLTLPRTLELTNPMTTHGRNTTASESIDWLLYVQQTSESIAWLIALSPANIREYWLIALSPANIREKQQCRRREGQKQQKQTPPPPTWSDNNKEPTCHSLTLWSIDTGYPPLPSPDPGWADWGRTSGCGCGLCRKLSCLFANRSMLVDWPTITQ